MSDNDLYLIEKARYSLHWNNWGAGINLIEQCRSEEAKTEINSIMQKLALREEAIYGTI